MALLGASPSPGAIADAVPLAPSPRVEGPPCGTSPSDWCAAPAGDPCGEHRDEKSCRGDSRCRGLPYRGESVVACVHDGKGFWTNCPAVGCVSRSDPSGRPPGTEIVKRLCGDPRRGGGVGEIHAWRTAKHELSVLELRSGSAADRGVTLYYDAGGRPLLSLPAQRVAGSDLARHLDEQRTAVLAGLDEAETIRCGP